MTPYNHLKENTMYKNCTISSGTLIESDIVESIRQFHHDKPDIVKLCADYDNESDSEIKSFIFYEEILDACQQYGATGYYFGSHEGNGSDIGYYKAEDFEYI